MGANWGNHERDYKELEPAIKNYASKALKTEVDDFIKHYKVCEDLQDKLPAALVKARAEGTAGSSLSDFKKNKGFYDAYKALDKAVDVLWKSQVKCKQMTNEAKQTVNDLKTLTEHMQTDLKLHEKELKESQDDLKKTQDKAKSGKGTLSPSVIKAADALEKDFKKNAPALEKLGKTIAGDIKDLVEAGNVYKSGVDQKMDNYAAKFEKMIDKTLDLAPPSDAKDVVGLPTALQEKVLVVAAKKAVADAKQIEKHCKAALEKAEKDKALAAPELKAASTGLAALKKVLAVQGGARKKYAPFIKKAENSKEIYKQFKFIDDAFATAEKTLVTTMKAIAAIK
ncbi:MAG: hypothetical protein ABIV25_00090 [Paracoccaceae bacterium]